MSSQFEIVSSISIASILGGVASVASTIYIYYANRKKEKEKLKASRNESFANVLTSNDLAVLGNYLDENIGRFNVFEYTANKEIENKINRYLEKIQLFIGTEESIRKEEPPQKPIAIQNEPESATEEILGLIDLVQMGEIWNALARLRMYIERELKNYAVGKGYKTRHLTSASQILQLLYERKHVRSDVYELLRYSISTCNRAIHGMDIPTGEAEQAVLSGVNALSKFLSTTADERMHRTDSSVGDA